MFKKLLAGTISAIAVCGAAEAQTCASYTYNLTNGTTADASQVMSNFDTIRNCANTLASGGTLTNTTLSGTTTLPGTSAFTSSGNMGIGTTSPSAVLHVKGTFRVQNGSDYIQPTQTNSNQLGWLVSGSSNYIQMWDLLNNRVGIGHGINPLSTLDVGGGVAVGSYAATNAAPSNGLIVSGNVGVGSSNPAVKLAVVGDIRTGTSGTNGCVQNFAGTGLTGTCSSDRRLKIVTGTISGVAEKFSQLDLVTFKWNDTAARLYRNSTSTINTGFLAQSVEHVFPQLVSVDDKGYEKLDYATLQLYGLQAIKELAAQNAQLQSRLEKTERRLADLEARNSAVSVAGDSVMTRIAYAFGWH